MLLSWEHCPHRDHAARAADEPAVQHCLRPQATQQSNCLSRILAALCAIAKHMDIPTATRFVKFSGSAGQIGVQGMYCSDLVAGSNQTARKYLANEITSIISLSLMGAPVSALQLEMMESDVLHADLFYTTISKQASYTNVQF